ncbi:hypothetical protein [Rhizobium sophoriradicis]|uniref:Uncharacterized protein n=1 Tax=Rhizobium sophoriradicis TaxID=1535245 RepID=A0A2A5KPJ2_9HYPH|nr:hypothetical protein [Rhizobium sophoriradicis]PCK78932.1 hypothetical protein CPT34_21430 [Rhizobium sophoriradicis]UWU35427.1 hypothetical protein N2597_03675 [Rhizobium leguminosarum bv. phaseoli]
MVSGLKFSKPGRESQRGHIDLFNEAKREVEEEIAVPDIDRSTSFGIGLAYDPVFRHPELTLLMPSKSVAASILAGAENAPDRNEAFQLLAAQSTNSSMRMAHSRALPKLGASSSHGSFFESTCV